MKTEFNKVIDFLETQQQENKLNTNQLYLIIQSLCTFLDDEQLQEVENLFNHQNNRTTKDFRIEYQDKDKNELFLSIVTAVDLEDATDYANKLMAETKINDLYTFVITEL
tara:strand:- start:955 stop:1284 length:330 start_codon:yes stop_codon:yes gene_type:complete